MSSKPRRKILEKYADFEENVLCVRTQTILKFLNDYCKSWLVISAGNRLLHYYRLPSWLVRCFILHQDSTMRYFNFEPSFKLPSGLGNYFACKRFADQTLLWSLGFVIPSQTQHYWHKLKKFLRKTSTILLTSF